MQCAARTSRNLLPFLPILITNHFLHFSSSSSLPSILTCHPCCGCLGGFVVGGCPAPTNVGRLLTSLFEEMCSNFLLTKSGHFEPVWHFWSKIFWSGPLARKIRKIKVYFTISGWRNYLITSPGHQTVHYIKRVVAGALQHKPRHKIEFHIWENPEIWSWKNFSSLLSCAALSV